MFIDIRIIIIIRLTVYLYMYIKRGKLFSLNQDYCSLVIYSRLTFSSRNAGRIYRLNTNTSTNRPNTRKEN